MTTTLDGRLSACAMLVSGKGIMVDVGTDHGYLPCYLVEHGICTKAIAADVNEKPLESAKAHIAACGLCDKVSAFLSDGLDDVPYDDVSDIVIAGMGGELIVDILARAKTFYKASFILQPMTRIELLRGWLWSNGFEIVSETASKEGYYYTSMLVKYSGENTEFSEFDTYIGRMKNTTDDEKGFLLKQALRLKAKGKGMLKGGDSGGEKYLELSRLVEKYAQGE